MTKKEKAVIIRISAKARKHLKIEASKLGLSMIVYLDKILKI